MSVFRKIQSWGRAVGASLGLSASPPAPVAESGPAPAAAPREEIPRLHVIVQNGGLDELESVLREGADANVPGRLGRTALQVAIEAADLEKMRLLVRYGADPELTDDFNVTPLAQAVSLDFAEGVAFLLDLGVDRGYQPRHPLKKFERDVSWLSPPLPAELQNVLSESEWQASVGRTQEMMRELGQHPTVEPVITMVESVRVLELLLRAGDELSHAPREVQRTLLRLPADSPFTATPAEFQAQSRPVYGTGNPQPMRLAFWRDMVRRGCNAYAARQHFDADAMVCGSDPVWCFERFGSTLTALPDGRYVQIAGEHEDYYDPDFYIYNDVVVHDGRGDFEIYGYPGEVFPPTDFHSATLTPDGIYLIGSLGYPEQRRAGVTPVYRLTLETWEITAVDTSGEVPGWIHSHRAHYVPERHAIAITGGKLHTVSDSGEAQLEPNPESFELDLARRTWRRVR